MRSSTRRFLLSVLCVALVAVAATVSVDAANTRGGKAPEIAITDGINGVTAKTTVADYAGSVTLFVVWLPVCPHCQKFMPEVSRLHATYAKRGLQVLTVTHGKKDWTAKYLADRKWTFGVGFDYTGVTAKRYGMKSMPGVYLIGADGHLRSYNGTLEQAIVDELPAPKKTP
ncbi:MAG: TlpA disulfide reductase family protein [Planctomycetota bacterium]|nr:TlpA disulfide reductase family protein [Planctomycetota bacterium]